MNGKLIKDSNEFRHQVQIQLDQLLVDLRIRFCDQLARAGGAADVAARALWKPNQSWVTEMDQIVHNWLTDAASPMALCRLVDAPIVSEEAQVLIQPSQVNQPSSLFFWLVDPIDGTRDLVEGRTGFAVSIALMRKDGPNCEPILGGILHPVSGAQWVGGVGCESTDVLPLLRKNVDRIDSHLVTDSLSASSEALIATRSNAAPSERYEKLLTVLGVTSVTKIGSAVKFCLLADSRADFYLRLGATAEWDTAAGDALLRSLGAGMIDIKTLQPLKYCKKDWVNSGFLAFRPGFNSNKLLTQIRQALAQI